jgi:hypothetical protein
LTELGPQLFHPGAWRGNASGKSLKEELMGNEARIGLLLGATACLLAVLVDWVVSELT